MDFRSAKKYLKPDGIWEAWHINSHKDFIMRMVPEITFKTQAHEDIIKEFEIIKSLMVQAYYKYQFFDVAFNKSLQDENLIRSADTRENLIKRLTLLYPQIAPGDIATAVYTYWPDSYKENLKYVNTGDGSDREA